jgi:hypothetical protein
MAGDEGDMPRDIEPAVAFEHAHYREAHGHQRRLRILREGELSLGPLEHQPRQVLPQRLVILGPALIGNRVRHAVNQVRVPRSSQPD